MIYNGCSAVKSSYLELGFKDLKGTVFEETSPGRKIGPFFWGGHKMYTLVICHDIAVENGD